MDTSSVSQRIFRSAGLAVPYRQQNIAAVHDQFVPFLKCFQDQFTRKFLPVGEKLQIPDPCCFGGLERDRIDALGAPRNNFGDFPAAEAVLPAKCTEVLVFHHEVWHEVKFRNRPTAGNSKFHKRGAPITPPPAPPSALQTAKGAPALKYKRIPFNKRLQKNWRF